jgi:hypothetical protein
MNHVIVDLDNCIADDAWRIPRINWQKANPTERYHDYHSLSGFDELRNEEILQDSKGSLILVFTARPVQYRPITEEWLRRRKVPFQHLIMRNNNDHRPSLELKRHMLHWLPEVYGVRWGSITAAYDDRPDVVEMYLKHGIHSEVRAVHNVCAYTPPTTTTASAA